MSLNYDQQLIGQRFQVQRRLGRGQQFIAFVGTDIQSGLKVVIKSPKGLKSIASLQKECKIQELLCSRHIPKLLYSNRNLKRFQVVQEYVGNSFKDVIRKCWSVETVTHFFICMLRALKDLHQLGYTHNDLKLSNTTQDEANPNKFYLIDFGLATKFMRQGQHLPRNKIQSRGGNLAVQSPEVMDSWQPSRKDDLISLFYLGIYLLMGSLPWQYFERTEKIKQSKLKLFDDEFLQSLDSVFIQFGKYCYNLDFEEKPNYERWINIFQSKVRLSERVLKSQVSITALDYNQQYRFNQDQQDDNEVTARVPYLNTLTSIKKIRDIIQKEKQSKFEANTKNQANDCKKTGLISFLRSLLHYYY